MAVTVAACISARFLRSRISAGAVEIIGIIAFALSFEVYDRVSSTEPWIKDNIYLGVIIVSAIMLICAGAALLIAYSVMRKDYAEFNGQ